MENLKLFFILLILLFANNLFSQTFYSDVMQEQDKDLKVVLYMFSSDFYFDNKEISKKKFEDLIRGLPSAQRDYVNGTNLRTFGNIIGVSSGIVFGYCLSLGVYNLGNRGLLGGSAALFLTGVIMDTRGRTLLKKSVATYNEYSGIGLNIGLTKNGVGIVLNF